MRARARREPPVSESRRRDDNRVPRLHLRVEPTARLGVYGNRRPPMALIASALAAWLLAGPRVSSPPPAVAHGSFSHLTVEDGLPHSYVRAIIKDRDGFMWFATARGLVRYDGARLVVYRHDPSDPASLPFGAPTCLLEDRERRLWVGTVSSRWAGLGVLDRSTGRFTRYLADGRPGSLSAPDVQAIYQDRQGRLWVGHAQGLDLFDPASKTFTAFPIGPAGSEPRVMAMLEDSRGTFWVATERSGLFQFDRASHAFRRFTVRDRSATGERNADDSFFAAFLEQPAGTLWVAGYGAGLVRIDLASGRTRRYLPDPQRADSLSVAQVVQLAGDGDRLVYVGTENGGLDVLDIPSETLHAPPSRPGRPAQPGQRVGLGSLSRRARPRLGRGERLRRELAVTGGAAVRGDPCRSRRPRRPARELDRRGRGRPDLGGHGRRRAARHRPADGTCQPLSAAPWRTRRGLQCRAERAGRPRGPDLGRLLECRALPHRRRRRPRPVLPPAGRPALADERQHLAASSTPAGASCWSRRTTARSSSTCSARATCR